MSSQHCCHLRGLKESWKLIMKIRNIMLFLLSFIYYLFTEDCNPYKFALSSNVRDILLSSPSALNSQSLVICKILISSSTSPKFVLQVKFSTTGERRRMARTVLVAMSVWCNDTDSAQGTLLTSREESWDCLGSVTTGLASVTSYITNIRPSLSTDTALTQPQLLLWGLRVRTK